MDNLKIEATKFTVVGALNFVLTFIIFIVMLKVLRLHYLFSLWICWFVGVLFSYVLNFVWVFKPGLKIQFNTRFIKFFLGSSLSIVLNMFALRYLVESTSLDPVYGQTLLLPLVVVFNFLTAKFWSLKPARLS